MSNAITAEKIRTFMPLMKTWWMKWWPGAVAFVVLLFGASYYVTFVWNFTESLPQKFFIVLKQERDVGRGQFAAFPWPSNVVYPKGIGFIKQVAGVPGDTVVVNENREFTIVYQKDAAQQIPGAPPAEQTKSVGRAKPFGEKGNMRGVPLELGFTGVIPEGYLYMYAWSKDSLDSRYAILGLVRKEAVIGRVIPVF